MLSEVEIISAVRRSDQAWCEQVCQWESLGFGVAYSTSDFSSLAEGQQLGAALADVPFVVAISGYHNDSNRHADLILPLLHGLHRWDFNLGHTLTGHPVVTVSQPVMDPPPGSRTPL